MTAQRIAKPKKTLRFELSPVLSVTGRDRSRGLTRVVSSHVMSPALAWMPQDVVLGKMWHLHIWYGCAISCRGDTLAELMAVADVVQRESASHPVSLV